MVSILPSARTPFDVFGAETGKALQSVIPGAVEKGFQRQTGLNAIDQLQADIANAKGDVSKMIPAIAKAYTLNPPLERSGIAEKLIPLAQRNQGTGEFPVGEGKNANGMPTKAGQQPNQEVPIAVDDLVQARPSMIQDPQGTSNYQDPYGPEEIANIRQQARQRGYLPEMEERFVKDALEFNEVARQRRQNEINNFDQREKERRATLENQAAFTEYLNEHAPEFAGNEDELELALKASEKYQGEKSFANRLAKVKNELRPYQAAKKALERNLQRPLFGQTKEQRDLNRPRAQFMIEAGQKPQLQLMIAKGGNGEVEEADLLNPLPQELENNLNKFRKFVDPLSTVTTIDPDSKEYAEQLKRGQDKFDSQKNQMTDFLSRNIASGTYDKPGTNLLLTRAHLQQKGLSWDAAGKLIDDAIAKGKIKLDPQQKIDYQRLGIPPLTGDSYFDTIMNNLMFPVTGKQ